MSALTRKNGSYIYIYKIKLTFDQAMEAYRVVIYSGSHIFQTIGSQTLVRLSTASRAGHAFCPRNIPGTYVCLRLGKPLGHNKGGKIR
jgi:hypothetical protein